MKKYDTDTTQDISGKSKLLDTDTRYISGQKVEYLDIWKKYLILFTSYL